MESKNKLKILLTGGHAGTVMLAVLEQLIFQEKDLEIHIVGPKYSFAGKGAPSLEKKYLKGESIFYHELDSGKLSKRFLLKSLASIPKLVFGFVSALRLMVKIRPNVTVSFGGYLAFPVVVASWCLGIPVIVHEQVVGFGLANRLSIFFAKKVLVARNESLEVIHTKKAMVIGNPVRKSIADVKPKTKMGNPPTIFIFTGSRASHVVNMALKEILPLILEKYAVIHLTGVEDLKTFEKLRNDLSDNRKQKYEVHDFILPSEVARMYQRADIIISRAGANTLAELMIIKRPAIMIPISWSNFDEQTKNAMFAREFGLGKIVREKDLNSQKLMEEIEFVTNNWVKIVAKLENKRSLDLLAAEKFAKLIFNEAKKKKNH